MRAAAFFHQYFSIAALWQRNFFSGGGKGRESKCGVMNGEEDIYFYVLAIAE